MGRSENNPWLHRFALLTAASTLALITLGGLVTSHGAGMAVPDWPTTYGYNMFFFPISQWIGGIFYEHSHRLVASGVGLLTTILAVWLWLKESRPWLRRLGVIALVAVIVQGVLGGLRVTLYKDQIGVFHATLAQLFFSLVCCIALFTSALWRRIALSPAPAASSRFRLLYGGSVGLVLLQLVLGATMRHQHAGLAVPDFPLAYGRAWPPMDEASLEIINQRRVDTRDFKPITAFQIGLHMAHRGGALLALVATTLLVRRAVREFGFGAARTRVLVAWLALILCQAGLGAATVWSNKAADIATAHVALGSFILAFGALIGVSLFRVGVRTPGRIAPDRARSISGQVVAGAKSYPSAV